ncbi:MAG: ankyrin repeat domain-containing protein [Bacteroidota bacterium]|nr:ankyrin repeat domain-containing protein [Bacteroidota bacterium]
MKNTDITDLQFLQAVEAIDFGDIDELKTIITKYPRLVKERLQTTEPGYFKDPYLLWFVADNPIRIEKLAPNIVEITSLLVQAVKHEAPDTYLKQITYTLGLVVTGRIPRECGVQIAMIDLLIDAGATPKGAMGALANGNFDAARHLLGRGDKLTLPVAVGLELPEEIQSLGITASSEEKLIALTVAAFYGKADLVELLLKMGADPNGYPESTSSFHSHATPLHQAVCSGSLDAVKLLVEAGAKLDAEDKIYNGTPLGWARHMQTDDSYDETGKNKFAVIESYLLSLS